MGLLGWNNVLTSMFPFFLKLTIVVTQCYDSYMYLLKNLYTYKTNTANNVNIQLLDTSTLTEGKY